jgi:hypothetical protein
METPKEKARELVFEKFKYELLPQAKQYALIVVNEIINCDSFFKTLEDTKEFSKYWYDVQSEIEKL